MVRETGVYFRKTMALGLAVVTLTGLTGLGGCVYPTRGAFWGRMSDQLRGNPGEALDPPRLRMGAMPFDAWYSPLILLGPSDVTEHRYRQGWWVGPAGDSPRGILYARRAGFLDLAHTRNAMDLTRFVYTPVLKAIESGRGAVRLMSVEPDVYHVRLADGQELSPVLQRELARKIAGRIAYLMTTWHEVATWHGYKGAGVFTERPSAFSYDDAASHMVGVAAAMDALEQEPRLNRFNAAATAALARQLVLLEALPGEVAAKRVNAVKGRWWANSLPQLRVVHLGLPDETLWARTLDDVEVATWTWDANDAVAHRRVNDWYNVEIELRLYERDVVLAAAGRHAGEACLIPRRDFPALRTSMLRLASPYMASRR